MSIMKKPNANKIISILLAIFMILPMVPSLNVSAASGITYYENNFELPLYGATGCPVKNVAGITAGTAFTIIAEEGSNLKVKLQNGTETTIAKSFCMINLPDVVPSIKYDITNSYNSVFKVRGANIAGITGQSIYQHGTSKKNNPRLGKDEYLVPVLYETAVKIAAAQKKALSENYTLVVYEAYRPTYAQDKVYAAYSPLVTADVRGSYPTSWFIASGKSNHQEGYAVDLSLAKVTSISFTTLSNSEYKRADLSVTNCTMITPIHDLTVDSAIYNYQSGMVIYDKTAWQSYTKTDAFAGSADSQRLQKYCVDAGLTPFAAEWWHFNDVDARNNLGNLADITGNWELTSNMSILKAAETAALDNSSGDTIHVLSHDVSANPLGLAYGGSQIHTSDGYYVKDGVEYPAYCVDPNLPGAGEVSVSGYDVTLSDSITDAKIYGIVLAGYPYKTIDELGVSNGWEANLATKLALRAYLKSWNINSFSIYGTDESGVYARVLAAIKSIYNAGMQNTAVPPAPSVTVTADGGNNKTSETGTPAGYLVKEYTIISNVQIKSYTVTLPSGIPTGTKITDLSGTEKNKFNSGEKFRIIIPKSSVTSSGSIKLDISGEVANQTLLYGTSVNSAYQDYVITGAPFTFKDANAYAEYDGQTDTPPPTEPTIPTEPTTPTTPTEPTIPTTPTTPDPGSMEIIKLDAGTNKTLSGAVFEIRNASGSVVAVSATDGSGKISISLPTGYYSVTEITPPQGYSLDTNPHRDNILIKENETTKVTFTNKKLPKLEITKVDADTNEPLAGVKT